MGKHAKIEPGQKVASVRKPSAKGKQLARDLASVFDEIRKELFAGMLESDIRRFSRILVELPTNVVDMGSAQKHHEVRPRRRIGRHQIKVEIPQSSHALVRTDILTSSLQRARGPRASD